MDEPELVHGLVTHAARYERPDRRDSRGFVNIRTRKTPDNRTGSIVGIDVQSAALIPEEAWEHMDSVAFRAIWIEDGSLAWSGEREMLEAALDQHAGNNGIEWLLTEGEHRDAYGMHHPTHTVGHLRFPISLQHAGKVEPRKPIDFVDDGEH
jgi:hypothetical protein